MSKEYEGQDPLDIAKRAEQDLNSHSAKQGHDAGANFHVHGKGVVGPSDSTLESGVDESVRNKFPGADVTYGSAAGGAGDNREIPLTEGGDINPETGKPYKARDYEGVGGPEDKAAAYANDNPGGDDVRGNIRQGGESNLKSGGQVPNQANTFADVKGVQ